MRFLKMTCYVALVLVLLILTGCGGDDDQTGDSSPVPPGSTQSIATQDTRRPVNPTLPPANATLPPAQSVNSNTGPETPATETGTIRLIHNIIDLPGLDIYIDGEPYVRNLEQFVDAPPTELGAGEHTLRVTDAVARGQESTAIVHLERPFTVETDQSTILILNGSRDAVTLAMLAEDLTSLNPGQSRIVLTHQLAGVNAINMFKENASLTDVLEFGETSQPILVTAEAQSLDIFNDQDTLLISVRPDFLSGYSYTVVLVGNPEIEQIVPVTIASPTPAQSSVRFTHASPNAPTLRLLLDDQMIIQELSFASTIDFQLLPSGRHRLKLVEAGTEVVLKETGISLEEYEKVDLVIYGRDDDLEISTFVVDESPIQAGYLRLTVFHAVPGEGRLMLAGPSALEYGLTVRYGQASSIELAPENAEFQFQAGSIEEPRVVEARPDPIPLEPGKVYTYIVTGGTIGQPILLVSEPQAPTDDSGNSIDATRLIAVRVVNAWTEPVEVDLNDRRIASGIGVEAISRPVSVLADFYDVRVYNSNQELLFEDNIQLLPSYRTYVLYVLPAEGGLRVAGVADIVGSPTLSAARVRFVHLAPDLPRVSIITSDGQDINQEVGYGDISGTSDILAGDIILSLTDNVAQQTVITFPPQTLQGGQSYEILILPDATNGVRLRPIQSGGD